jgi:hypothetical protein
MLEYAIPSSVTSGNLCKKMEWHIPTLQRLPGVTEDGMTYSNIVKVMQGYRRWNIPTLQRLPEVTEDGTTYSNITKVTRGY